jgi:hypothetical protein
MRGSSSMPFFLQRAGGWCKPVGNACESILERNTEKLGKLSKYLRLKPLSLERGRQVSCLQLGWQRGYTLVPMH